jgi:hypothetical protein
MIAPTNPYARTHQQRLEQQRLQLRLQEQLLLQHGCSGKENSSEVANMAGLQSQWRGGSIKNCKKRAVKLKIRSNCRKIAKQHKKNKHFLQQAMDGGIAFVPHLHCRICVALQKQKMASYSGAKVSIPHRAHHPRCPQNINTPGRSERHVEVEKYAKKMIERNNLPLAKGQLEELTSVKQHFSVNSNDGIVLCHTTTQFNMKTNETPDQPTCTEQPAAKKKVPAGKDRFFYCLEVKSEDTFQDFYATPVASYLRKKLDELSKNPKAVAKAEKTNAPLAVALMVGHITKQIHHIKNSEAALPSSDTFLDAYARYREFFSLGQIRFSFPKERQDLVPSPLYHSLEGSEYIHVDWHLRKMLHKPEIVKTKLMSWWLNYRTTNEDGLWLCNKATEPAIRNQMGHTQDIQFPDGVEMYREIKPGPRSKHGLSTRISSNPEPAVESWHGRFANFGNTGMAAGLSDCLHLKGTAEGNVKIRHVLAIQEDDMVNEWLPSHHPEKSRLEGSPARLLH